MEVTFYLPLDISTRKGDRGQTNPTAWWLLLKNKRT